MYHIENKLVILQSDPRIKKLSNADPELNKLINIVGGTEINLRPNYFDSLIRSIIGQLVSTIAADAIYRRFTQLLENKITPANVQRFSDEQLRSTGLSRPKVSYIRDLTDKVFSGEVNLSTLDQMENEEVIQAVTSVKGIGKWTSEVFLIFSLGRMDVLPVDDVGLQRAFRWLYALNKEEDVKVAMLEKSKVWGKNTTIACLYLWEVIHLDLLKYEGINAIH